MFVIQKATSRMGGAFSNSKLVYKEEDQGLKTADLEFISSYFLAIAMQQIQKARETLMDTQATQNCGPYVPPPTQCDPFEKKKKSKYYCKGLHKKKKKGGKKKKRQLRGIKNWKGVFPTTDRSHLHYRCNIVGCARREWCRHVYTDENDCCGTCQGRMLLSRRSNSMNSGGYWGYNT